MYSNNILHCLHAPYVLDFMVTKKLSLGSVLCHKGSTQIGNAYTLIFNLWETIKDRAQDEEMFIGSGEESALVQGMRALPQQQQIALCAAANMLTQRENSHLPPIPPSCAKSSFKTYANTPPSTSKVIHWVWYCDSFFWPFFWIFLEFLWFSLLPTLSLSFQLLASNLTIFACLFALLNFCK